MKLLLAIVNKDDANYVNSGLSKAGFIATKISSTGGFLLSGNTTFLIGVDDGAVEKVFEIIARYSKKRTVHIPADPLYSHAHITAMPTEVTVGGATIFVLNVERFEHI